MSRRTVLIRVWQLRDEISTFLALKDIKVPEFEDLSRVSDFAFLVECRFFHFPSLNLQDNVDENKYTESISNLQVNLDTRYEDFRHQQQSFDIFAKPFSFGRKLLHWSSNSLTCSLAKISRQASRMFGVISIYVTLPFDYISCYFHTRKKDSWHVWKHL